MKTLIDREGAHVYLIDSFLDDNLLDELLMFLKQIKFTCDIFKFGSKLIESPRKTHSFCFEPNLTYNYTQQTKTSTFINDENHILKKVWNTVQQIKPNNHYDTHKLNYVLINHYSNGKEYVGWHRDNEKSIDQSSGIFSLSLGEERSFQIKEIQTKKIIFNEPLCHNSMIIMCGENMQHKYKHQVPKRLKMKNERFNLTFRCVKK